jgi:hypothetical protein
VSDGDHLGLRGLERPERSGEVGRTLPRTIRAASRVTVGALLALGDRTSTLLRSAAGDDEPVPAADPRWRHLVIGTAFAAEDAAVGLSAGAARAVERVTPVTGWLWEAPAMAPVRRRVEESVDALVARGEREEALATEHASRMFAGTLSSVTESPVIDDVVNEVVGRVLGPVLDEALPKVMTTLEAEPELLVPLVDAIVGEVLDPIMTEAIPKALNGLEADPALLLPLVQAIVAEALEPILRQALPTVVDVLNEDPDTIRALVRDQSTGIVGEMADTVRTRAASADDHVDRIVRRLTFRKPIRELEPQPPTTPPTPVELPPAGS